MGNYIYTINQTRSLQITGRMSVSKVKHIVLVLSGKGGVGKSSITTQLALSLSLAGHSVGILDIDLTGPSIPRLFGIESAKVTQAPGGWIPVPVHPANSAAGIGSLSCMSLGFLLRERGDAVVVTTPQAVATADVKKELNFCTKTGINVIGVVENMSGFVCPNCSECTNVFSSGGGKVMAQEFGVKFLASVPIDPQFVMLVETGRKPVYPVGTEVNGQSIGSSENGNDTSYVKEPGMLVEKYKSCSLCPIFETVAKDVIAAVEQRAIDTASA